MSLMASFVDGKLQTSTASSNSLKDKETNASGMDSNAFLTLLVAEMQNQDPLEPSSNTEWVSQYATFTQVSEIQEIGNDMSNIKAQDLVGKDVIMKVTSDNGETDYVSGKVDYVTYEDGEAYLSIEDSLYSVNDLDTVASDEYMEAYSTAKDIVNKLSKLPIVEGVTLANQKEIEEIYDKSSNLNDYQKTFLDKSVFDKISEYYAKIKSLLEKNTESDKTDVDANDADTNDITDNSDGNGMVTE